MASNLTEEAAKALLYTLVGHAAGAYASPAEATGLYVALLTVAPAAPHNLTQIEAVEASYAGYARLQIKGSAWTVPTEAEPDVIKNSGVLKFANATAGANQIITHVALVMKEAKGSGGMAVAWGALAAPVTVNFAEGKYPVEIAAEKLELTLL